MLKDEINSVVSKINKFNELVSNSKLFTEEEKKELYISAKGDEKNVKSEN